MPSTRSRAATKCISEVPGLAKQTSTPPATKVRTRLSAPFIVPLPFATFLECIEDQSFLAHFVKGFADIAAIAANAAPFLTAAFETPIGSRAATKCISEVPGLAKQTSTPPATKVRTRLSAPFIVPLPFATFLECIEDQSFLAHFVKGFADIAAIAAEAAPFLTAAFENRSSHVAVACEIAPIMACLAGKSIFAGDEMIRAFALLFAAATLLAGTDHARAQDFD